MKNAIEVPSDTQMNINYYCKIKGVTSRINIMPLFFVNIVDMTQMSDQTEISDVFVV